MLIFWLLLSDMCKILGMYWGGAESKQIQKTNEKPLLMNDESNVNWILAPFERRGKEAEGLFPVLLIMCENVLMNLGWRSEIILELLLKIGVKREKHWWTSDTDEATETIEHKSDKTCSTVALSILDSGS